MSLLTLMRRRAFSPLTDARVVSFFDTKSMGTAPAAIVTDSFDRANSAVSLGTADSGHVWTAQTGTWGITSNKAYTPVLGFATVNTGSADGLYDVTAVLGTGITAYLVFRWGDINNYHYVGMSSNAISLRQVIAGVNAVTNTGADTATVPTSIQGDTRRLTVRVVGPQVEVMVDGIQYIAASMPGATMTALGSNTVAGLRTNDTTLTYNDYSAKTPGLVSGLGIDAWIDRKALSTAVQTDVARRMTYKVVGSVPYVRGVGNGNVLILGFPAGITQDNMTVVWIGHNATPATEQVIVGLPTYTSAGLIQANGQVMARAAGYEYTGLAQSSSADQVVVMTGLSASSPAAPGRGVRVFQHGQRMFRTQDSNNNLWGTAAVTTGVFAGISSAQPVQNFVGDTRALLIYNTALTPLEVRRLAQWAVTYYGLSALVTPVSQIVFDGDSLTTGQSGTSLTTTYTDVVLSGLAAPAHGYNLGVSGQTVVQMTADALTQVDPLYDASLTRNLLVAWAGTNDMNGTPSAPATAYANYVAYCQARRAAGWKVVAVTCLPRGAVAQFETDRQAFNALVVANWATFADALANVGADATIGAASAQDNTTYYQTDKIHLKAPGYAIVAGLVSTALATL